MPVRVFVVSNFRLLLYGIEALLSQCTERFHLSGKTESFDGLCEAVVSAGSDLLLLDIDSMPDHLSTQLSLFNTVPSHLRILLLTRLSDCDMQDKFLIAGARGVINCSVPPKLFLEALEKVHEGQVWLNRQSTGRLWSELTDSGVRQVNSPSTIFLSQLSEREQKILRVVLGRAGDSTKGIAEHLHVSESTLRNYLTSIYKKAGVSNRAGLLARSLQNGLHHWLINQPTGFQ